MTSTVNHTLTTNKVWLFLNNRKVIFWVWVLLVAVVALKHLKPPIPNNYLIFKYAFFHAVDHLNLYAAYPQHHLDANHYGPFFSLLIAPFALMPDFFGMLFWQLANVLFLFYAIKQLPLTANKINAVYWIITHEMLTAMFSLQPNISIAAIIILAYAFIIRGKNFWAAFVIMLGTFVKLYGIVGLAFFFFAKQKSKFILYLIICAVLFLIMPAVFFGSEYILQCYRNWAISLSEKQMLNANPMSMQDISVMGFVRRILHNSSISDLPFLVGGGFLFLMPYLRVKCYANIKFQLLLLASTLIFVVIFSNSSESPTYIIAFAGVAVWYTIQQRKTRWDVLSLFIFAFILTTLSPSDIFPKFIRETYIKPYSLKALPCILIWFYIVHQQLFNKFESKSLSMI